MKRIGLLVVFAATSIIAGLSSSGCGEKKDSAAATPTPFNLFGAVCPTDFQYTYYNWGEPFFRDWCTGCHSSNLPEGSRQNAPPNVNFDDYSDIRQWGVEIYGYAAVIGGTNGLPLMPPAGGTGTSQAFPGIFANYQVLGQWLACNAPVGIVESTSE
jgi:hypothetical protein